MSEQLAYGSGSIMEVEPINISLNTVAHALRQSDPMVVILEPGDATRYRLLLTPCWAPGVEDNLGDVGVPANKASDYLLVTKFDSDSGDAFFASSNIAHFDVSSNHEWTRVLLSWWLRQLWKEIERVSA